MPVERNCEDCGQPFTAKTRRAKFCSDLCRVRANRRPTKVGKAKAASAIHAVPDGKSKPEAAAVVTPPAPTYDTLEDQVVGSLTDLNALDTIAGRAAVRVAQQIDHGGDGGSAVVSLSKELSRLVAEAKVEAAPRNRDKADDIAMLVNQKILRLVSEAG